MPLGCFNTRCLSLCATWVLSQVFLRIYYMDDIICLNSTFEAHLKSLGQMFSALQAAGLTLKPTRLQFGQKDIEYLGHVIVEKTFQSLPTVSKPF